MGSWNCKMWTFVIGLIAGAAPFLSMSYLPHLIDPQASVTPPDLGGLLVVGIVVGLITLVMDSRRFAQEDPREVLMRSLAIPSILLATVTGLKAHQAVEGQRAEASARVDTVATDVNIIPAAGPTEELTNNKTVGFLWVLPRAAEAQEHRPAIRAVSPGAMSASYLVVLGTYGSAEDARHAASRWREGNALATERYYQKSIRVYSAGASTFYVTYTTTMPRGEAAKLYKLLRINDPNVTPQVILLPARAAK